MAEARDMGLINKIAKVSTPPTKFLFKKGDIVKLKGQASSPIMTVNDTLDFGEIHRYDCIYWHLPTSSFKKQTFDGAILEKASK